MARAANPLISVIIPGWNAEKYVDACVRSVVGQTYKNLEIILVNDGSPDGFGKKCDEWAKKDKRVKVVHKPKNEYLNYARRDGFKQATGRYVTFLDSDDLLHKDAIKLSYEALAESGADAVVYAFAEFSDRTEKSNHTLTTAEISTKVRILDNKEQIVMNALLGDFGFANTHYMTAWGKLYDRKLVEKVDWKKANFRVYEDNFWTPQILTSAKKVALLSAQLYFYRRNVPYGAVGSQLGNKMTGNSVNGKPVGYAEFVDLLYDFNQKLASKHGVDITSKLKMLRHYQMWQRMNNLIDAGLLGEENNLKYLKEVWHHHLQQDHKKDARISSYKTETERMNAELAAHLGVKRSARLLMGNVKRKLLKPSS